MPSAGTKDRTDEQSKGANLNAPQNIIAPKGLNTVPDESATRIGFWSRTESWRTVCLSLITLALIQSGTVAQSRVASPLRLTVSPSSIELSGPDSRQRLLVTGTKPDGSTVDLTRTIRISTGNPRVVVASGNLLRAASDGKTTLTVSAQGASIRVPVRVSGYSRTADLTFVNDITPILSRSGCNSSTCHAKAGGQNGFKLSIFGYDPDADLAALVREGHGRRISVATPDQSLLLRKATGAMPHGGGARIAKGSYEYRTLLRWIKAGAQMGRANAPTLAKIEVSPRERELIARTSQQLLVTAVFTDGSRRDVTDLAGYSSNADHVAAANEGGLVKSAGAPGEAAVMVRYMGAVGVSRVLIAHRGARLDATAYAPLGSANFIDRLVEKKLKRLGIAPSGPADDAAFLRRVSIDLIGTLPTPSEARGFLSDPRPDRRERLVDGLLKRPEYASNWALRWADVLRVDREALGPKGAYVFHRWLRERMQRNVPYDQWVREVLIAQGSTAEVGPANLYRAVKTPDELANTVSQVFLGVRLQCAQCHHHPFEKWSQEDFWGLAGFFTRVQRKPLTADSDRIYVGGTDEARHPRTGGVVQARLLESTQSPLPEEDRRQALADWLTGPHNRFFARMLANRMWAHLMGRGLVDPVDDMRDTNPASNEPLLDELANFVGKTGFNQKALLRKIVTSRVYQLSAVPNATNAQDTQNFSRAYVKRLPAETLLDAICDATEVPEKYEGVPEGVRALDLWDNRLPSYFLDTFGRPLRAGPCECERSQEPSMSQALHLMNSPTIHSKVASRTGRVARLVRSGASPKAIAEDLYLAALSRMPSADERRSAVKLLEKAPDRRSAGEDLLWALMNSFAFVFNR